MKNFSIAAITQQLIYVYCINVFMIVIINSTTKLMKNVKYLGNC